MAGRVVIVCKHGLLFSMFLCYDWQQCLNDSPPIGNSPFGSPPYVLLHKTNTDVLICV